MNPFIAIVHHQKTVCLCALILTLGVIHFVDSPLVVLCILLSFWALIFYPWSNEEPLIFLIASAFFLGQNFAVIKAGGFSFKQQNVLLMPWYEPFLWGFYYTGLKRFVAESPYSVKLERRSFWALLMTIAAFSLFSNRSGHLFAATCVTTGLLFILFHGFLDLCYAACALGLGFIVEFFGVSSGLWEYPDPDYLGIPYWSINMWLSVGILGRRFLIPLGEWVSMKLRTGASFSI